MDDSRGGSRKVEGEEGGERGHELSERNNISPEELFTWRERHCHWSSDSPDRVPSPGKVSSSSSTSR